MARPIVLLEVSNLAVGFRELPDGEVLSWDGPAILVNTGDVQLTLGYESALTNKAEFEVGSGGDLTITPSGGDVFVVGNLDLSGGIQVDLTANVDGNFSVNTNKFNVTAATGAIASTGAALLDSGGTGSSFGGDLAVLASGRIAGHLKFGAAGLSAWNASYKAIEWDESAIMGHNTASGLILLSNAYLDTSGDFIYKSTGATARYDINNNGEHVWWVKSSGTAGNVVTYVQAMKIANATGAVTCDVALTSTGDFTVGASKIQAIAASGRLVISEKLYYDGAFSAYIDSSVSGGHGGSIRIYGSTGAVSALSATFGATGVTVAGTSTLTGNVGIGQAPGSLALEVTGSISATKATFRANSSGYYWSATGAITVGVAGTYVKVSTASSTTSTRAANFTIDTNNRATYTGTVTQTFKVTYMVSLHSASAGQILALKVAKNGTVIDSSYNHAYFQTGNVEQFLGTQEWVELATNDYVELWGTNDTAANDGVVHSGNCTISEA